jgi:hypothetical protein
MDKKGIIQLGYILILFGIGLVLFLVGMLMKSPEIVYSSIAVSSIGLIISIVMYFKNRKKPIDFTIPQPPKIYRDPTMKRNKSDTNLELIGQEKYSKNDNETENNNNKESDNNITLV